MQILVPDSQRRTLTELTGRLDLSVGDSAAKRSAFWMMLVLSGIIATAGVIGDSTATVIGAMIVAPLSTPILGIGLGIATGRGRLIGQSVLLVLAGVILVMALGVVLALFLPNAASVLSNSQVTGRTSPKLMDLIAALATGLVAAMAVTRRDVGDVLPGVAIAISLVPPLGVAGVTLAAGYPALALGAFILFSCNVVAMVIMTSAVLLAAGYTREARAEAAVRRSRSYLVLAAVFVLVVVPITVNSLSSLWAGQIADATQDWLKDVPGAEVTDVTLQSKTATITVLGPQELPPVDELQHTVADLVPWDPEIVLVHTVGNRVSIP